MGDHRTWSPELNGVVMEEKLSSSSSSSSPPPLFLSNHAKIGAACWGRAEEATQGIIDQIQPTLLSEQRRKAVIDYVQRLIRNYLGCEVFPFGSVPLKTYLPDGDIDLTAFGGINVEEALVNNVFSVLESEDQNGAAEFVVKDVQLIRAEVKLVKCLVQNIVVDISFNQLGGLCTLCFLEQVDRLIGKDHLFKRSIILIKAWCYYESRILGAHHGLISTYALETLVLFIFHLFYSTLNGPLEVLFKFLDYFSKFDWDNFGISLHGPVRISLLPDIVVETPDNDGEDLLLSNDILTNCIETFSVPAKGHEPNTKTFPQKYLNIVDPLKENNNLGRSVSKGNFYRIRSAFTYGARKLGRVLSQSEENIENEVRKFFTNTLDRHGNGQRPDVQDLDPSSRYSGLVSAPLFSGIEFQEDRTINGSEFAYSGGNMEENRQVHSSDTDVEIPGNENNLGVAVQNELLVPVAPSKIFSEVNGLISHYRLSGDANELATSRIEGHAFSERAIKSFPSSVEATLSPSTSIYAPHLLFSRFSKENEELKNGILDKKHSESSGFSEKLDMTGHLIKPSDDKSSSSHGRQDVNHMLTHQDLRAPAGTKSYPSHMSPNSSSSQDFYSGYYGYRGSIGYDEIPEALSSLSDLSGDYDSHVSSWHYGRWCYDNALTAGVPSVSPSLLPQSPSKKQWDITRHLMQVKGNPFTQINSIGLLQRPPFCPIGSHILHGGTSFSLEEVQKPRGTGTYFPNMTHYRERPSPRTRNQVPVRSPRSNGRVSNPPELNPLEKSNRELSQTQTVHQGGIKLGHSDHISGSGSPGRKVHHHPNGLMHRPEQTAEHGSTGFQQENRRRPSSVSLLSQNLNINLSLLEVQNSKPVLDVHQERVSAQSYELKDDGDFPPLSI